MRNHEFRAAVLILAVTAGLRAQSTSASLLGQIRDAGGGSIAATKLTLLNLAENTSSFALSDSAGLYQFPNLEPGTYLLKAESAGFRAAEAPGIALNARESRRVDFRLEIASRTESALVQAQPATIETESGAIADSKNFEQVTRLPFNRRAANSSPFSSILVVPGVQQDRSGRLSIAGGMPSQIEYSVDGISVLDSYTHSGMLDAAPSYEMLSEFRVASVAQPASSGLLSDITIVSRSGANQFHGSLFWYHQNRVLDAKTYGAPAKPQKIYNAFGGSFGGPVRLPWYDGHDRTFFFFDYEGNRQPQSALRQQLLPTAAQRQGDLTALPGGSVVDPTNRIPFPQGRIPAARLNPVANRLLSRYYPLPNVENPNAPFNYLVLARTDRYAANYDGRLDQVISGRQRLFARWSGKPAQFSSPWTPLPEATVDSYFRSLTAAHTWTPNGRVANEFRFGFVLFDSHEDFPIKGEDAVADLGLRGLDLRNVAGSAGFPGFIFSDGTQFASIGHGRSAASQSRNIQFNDTLTWIHNRHTLKFGADLRRLRYRSGLFYTFGDDFGTWVFQSGMFSGNAFADLLLGLPAETDYQVMGPDIRETSRHAALFAQDSWRIRRGLSLELGLRWEVHPPMREDVGNAANFDHGNGNVILPDQTIPAAPGFLQAIHACSLTPAPQPCTAVLRASEVHLPQALRTTDRTGWGPRAGFAWTPWASGKTVFRAGAGIYTQSLYGRAAYWHSAIHSSDSRRFFNTTGASGQPLLTLPDILPSASELGSIPVATFDGGIDPTLRDPRSYQWNFTVEQELSRRTSVRATYVGTQTTGLVGPVDFNQLPAGAARFDASRRPYPLWTYLGSLENVGFSNYQGLQLEANRRYHAGAFLQASYVFSKNLGAAGSAGNLMYPPEVVSINPTDRFNTRYDRGNLGGSRRHRFLLTGLFPLPFGQGRRLGAAWRGLTQGILGGWELSTVTLFQSGSYQTPTIAAGSDQSNTAITSRGASARPDRIGNGNLPHPTRDLYYDRTAFVATPAGAGRFGNAGAGILQGPGTIAVAAGLAKTFRVTERARVRIEGTFTNLPNHPNFLPPNVVVSSPLFGRLTSVQSAENSGNRTGQIGARLDF